MDLVKRNAEIVALVKARKMPMRAIAARYRLSTSSISLIAIRHGVHAQAADPKKVQVASKLIQRGMPLRHVAQTVGLDYQRLRHLLEKLGVYEVPPQMGGLGAIASCASCDGITAGPVIRCAPSRISSVALARALMQRRPCSG
jgi:lambda repressor-like predicted transcriptional regulator